MTTKCLRFVRPDYLVIHRGEIPDEARCECCGDTHAEHVARWNATRPPPMPMGDEDARGWRVVDFLIQAAIPFAIGVVVGVLIMALATVLPTP